MATDKPFSATEFSVDEDEDSEDNEHVRKRSRGERDSAPTLSSSGPVDLPTLCCAVCSKQRLDRAMQSGGVDASRYKYVVLDIEGTTTPITFVKDVLFPFAQEKVKSHLETTWSTEQTQNDIVALREQAKADKGNNALPGGMPDVSALVAYSSGAPISAQLLASTCGYVYWNIATDRKIGALKQLQGHIWELGYASGELSSIVYKDVPKFMSRMRRQGVRVCIYSSGSREAQKLLFKYSDHGDLRYLLSCYFDTKVGHKRESNSYREIVMSLGVDSPEEILFVTDIIEEAQAAKEAGLHAVLSVRPGNAPLPSSHPFQTVTSFEYL